MGFHKDLRLAIQAVALADTAPTVSLVALTGNVFPIRYAGLPLEEELPGVTYFFVDTDEGTAADRLSVVVQFTAWNHPARSGGLYLDVAEDIRDRVKAIMTHTNLLAQGVDAAPMNPSWNDIPPSDDGIVGLALDIEFFNGK